jgi:hypothetical protein
MIGDLLVRESLPQKIDIARIISGGCCGIGRPLTWLSKL